MRPLLGIELGQDRCVLALVDDDRPAGGQLHASAHHVVKYTDPVRLSEALRRLRVAHHLPRRARVVIWPEAGDAGVTPVDRAEAAPGFRPDLWQLRERLRPIVRAGFRVSAALAPADAVAALAALSPASASAALVVAPDAGCLAVTTGGRTLFARELSWKFAPPQAGAPLLDRYAFAAQVLPLLSYAMRFVKERCGVTVDRVVLCGSAPALRALSVPLIEELDLEVETLDGVSGVGGEEADAEAAASFQLAAGAALAPEGAGVIGGLMRPVLTPGRILAGAAAAAAVILLVLLFWPARQASGPQDRTSTVSGPRKPRRAGLPPNNHSASVGEPCARKSVSA